MVEYKRKKIIIVMEKKLKNLKEGKHYVFAERTTLSDTVASLRAQPAKAMSIAQDASNFVHHYLTTACVQKLF